MMQFAAFHLGPDCLTSLITILSFFVQKMMSAFYVYCEIPNTIKTTFILVVKTMNPDQTAVDDKSCEWF